MNVHAAANEFPLFDGDRLRQLADDIASNGQRETIKLFRGEILDGRNRAAACELIGAQPITESLPDDVDPYAYVWSLNGQRRDLTAAQRFMIWESCHAKSEAWTAEIKRIHDAANAARSEKAKGNDHAANERENSAATQSGETVRDHKAETKRKASTAKAAASGTDRGTVERVEKLERERPDLAAQVRCGAMTLTQAQRVASEDAQRSELNRPVAIELPGLQRGDFRELAKAIPNDSVELVFTDPPYDDESVPLFGEAAKHAARILKPGGSMLCYCGHMQLPRVLPLMLEHLRYWWICQHYHDGGPLKRMDKMGIIVHGKPMIWLVKGTRGDKTVFVDDYVGVKREKDFHPWQQAESIASYYIEKLTKPNGVVVDFFAGGGTTLVAADSLGRRYAGFEISAKYYESAAARLQNLKVAA